MTAPRSRITMTVLPLSPTRALIALLRTIWRRHRCAHLSWTPLDGCTECGKEAR